MYLLKIWCPWVSKLLLYDNLVNKSVHRNWPLPYGYQLLDANPLFITVKVPTQCVSPTKKCIATVASLNTKKLCKPQQEQPPDFCSACAAAPEADDPVEGLRFMSTISSCFADDSASSPGRDPAILRNKGYRIQEFCKSCQMFEQSWISK